jgi:hypothetical protein
MSPAASSARSYLVDARQRMILARRFGAEPVEIDSTTSGMLASRWLWAGGLACTLLWIALAVAIHHWA